MERELTSDEYAVAWRALGDEVHRELIAWRAEHPRATLTEIEVAVQTITERLRARWLHDLVVASPCADLREVAVEERPRCPECGGTLALAGQHERELLVPGQGPPLRIERSYGVCTACGNGVFPPG
jgi:ribosomal protein S27AE